MSSLAPAGLPVGRSVGREIRISWRAGGSASNALTQSGSQLACCGRSVGRRVKVASIETGAVVHVRGRGKNGRKEGGSVGSRRGARKGGTALEDVTASLARVSHPLPRACI